MNKVRKGRKGAQNRTLAVVYICVKNYIHTYILIIYLLIYEITYILKHCAPFRVRVNDTNGLSMGRNVFIAPLIAPLLPTLRPFLQYCAPLSKLA